jgi:AcrR family transcriptional regulator
MSMEKLDTEIRQRQIREAALRCVGTSGVRGLSMAALARQVGLSPAAIYRHFRNKDEVLDGVLDMIQEMILAMVRATREEASSAIEALHRLLGRHLQLIRENAAIPRTVFSDELFGGDPARKTRVHRIVSSYLTEVERIVRDGQDRGEIRREIDPETIALLFLGIVQPSAILWHLSEGRFHATRHAERAWRLLRDAIATQAQGSIEEEIPT